MIQKFSSVMYDEHKSTAKEDLEVESIVDEVITLFASEEVWFKIWSVYNILYQAKYFLFLMLYSH